MRVARANLASAVRSPAQCPTVNGAAVGSVTSSTIQNTFCEVLPGSGFQNATVNSASCQSAARKMQGPEIEPYHASLWQMDLRTRS